MPRKRVRMGIDDDMEIVYEYPPAFYAQKIYDKCIRKSMLIYDGRVWRVVQQEIKRDILIAIRHIFFEEISQILERGRVGLQQIFIEENRRFVSMVDMITSVFSEEGLEEMLRDERYGGQDLRTAQRRLF